MEVKKSKKVAVYTLYCKEGASSNYRILMYLDDLKKVFDVDTFAFWNRRYVLKYMPNKKKYIIPIVVQFILNTVRRLFEILIYSRRYDIIILQKGVIPACRLTLIGYMKRQGCKVIFDVDDAVYLNKRDNSNQIAKEVNLVVVGNDSLKEHYLAFNKKTIVLPTVDYSPAYKKYIRDTYNEKIIGWIGSKNTVGNLEVVVNAINTIIKKHPEVKFYIISNTSGGYDSVISNTVFIPWSLENYVKCMAYFTIGIMPLFDTPFNKGKCGFKLIQYMNLSKPVIASPVGVNAKIVGKCGLVASTEDEWVNCLETLLYDYEKYKECIRNMETDFDSQYSYFTCLKRWINIINSF